MGQGVIEKSVEWASQKLFQAVHQNKLIYNTCWEDPRIDRQALNIQADDIMMVITSAGCNVLDYALLYPQEIHAVDMNVRQNALLELKIAGIRSLTHEPFFEVFGRGSHPDFQKIYSKNLRPLISEPAQEHWDKHLDYFNGEGRRSSFYYRGASGYFAHWVHHYLDLKKLTHSLTELFHAKTLEEQKKIYSGFEQDFWGRWVKWVMSWDATLSLLGVPRPQRQQIEKNYDGGILKFMQDCVESVFTKLSIQDNYFWWLYMFGSYTPDRCPEYLKAENFEKLKTAVDRISVHTSTVHDFVEGFEKPISKFVLLDHMDWLSTYRKDVLEREWQAIAKRAKKEARILWRSGGLKVEFVDPILVKRAGRSRKLKDFLSYQTDLAKKLHPLDRVHTYGSFYIADLA